jgi:hypothetical protein
MECLPPDFRALVQQFTPYLGYAPNGASFVTLVLGWVLCHGRRTLSGLIRAAGPFAPKSHDAYQNFFSKSRWKMDTLWQVLFRLLVAAFAVDTNRIWLAGDDTLAKHRGPKIWGAGLYRDAVRSSRRHAAYAWGLNWVVLVMVVPVRLLGTQHLIALPILARLNVKEAGRSPKHKGRGAQQKKTTVTLMGEMITLVAQWMPEAHFLFCGDGAYACLAGSLPANVHLVSRMRCDAALYAPAPKRRKKGQRGPRPRKGKRLSTPKQRAQRLRNAVWRTVRLVLYGETVERLVYDFTALWYDVRPDAPVRIVCVRDPKGKRDDEFFFATDLHMRVVDILQTYAGRWSIEVVFRECKQYLGLNDPQARTKSAVLRMTPFCLWLNALVKYWFLCQLPTYQLAAIHADPWYAHKTTISFQDMLTAIRTHFWRSLFSTKSTQTTQSPPFANVLPFIVRSLAKVV